MNQVLWLRTGVVKNVGNCLKSPKMDQVVFYQNVNVNFLQLSCFTLCGPFLRFAGLSVISESGASVVWGS